jgi:hypothetical protein
VTTDETLHELEGLMASDFSGASIAALREASLFEIPGISYEVYGKALLGLANDVVLTL